MIHILYRILLVMIFNDTNCYKNFRHKYEDEVGANWHESCIKSQQRMLQLLQALLCNILLESKLMKQPMFRREKPLHLHSS